MNKFGVTGSKASKIHIYSSNVAKRTLLPREAACGVKLSHEIATKGSYTTVGGMIETFGLCANCARNEKFDESA